MSSIFWNRFYLGILRGEVDIYCLGATWTKDGDDLYEGYDEFSLRLKLRIASTEGGGQVLFPASCES